MGFPASSLRMRPTSSWFTWITFTPLFEFTVRNGPLGPAVGVRLITQIPGFVHVPSTYTRTAFTVFAGPRISIRSTMSVSPLKLSEAFAAP